MELEFFDADKHLAVTNGWRAARDVPPLPPDILPRLGVIAKTDYEYLASVHLDMSNSNGVCRLEWLVTNPAPSASVFRATSLCIDFLEEEAARHGYTHMLSTADPRLASIERRRLGFTALADDLRLSFKILTPREVA